MKVMHWRLLEKKLAILKCEKHRRSIFSLKMKAYENTKIPMRREAVKEAYENERS
jgi:hypothetical protein